MLSADATALAGPEAWPMVRPTRRQTCATHRPFATEAEAWAHYLAQLVANAADPGQEVYRCPCGSWHHGGAPFRSLGRLLAESGWDDEAGGAP